MKSDRTIEVHTPLGDDALRLRSMTTREELGRPFEYELELISEEPSIDFAALLGQEVTVAMVLPDGEERYFSGIVAEFSQAGMTGRYHAYRAQLRPWLWLLTRTADCRIYQEMSVPEIVKEIFRDNGFSDFEECLGGSYEPREYCVQYRETDFDFVSRLLEAEGIYYFFRHEDGKHTLVLSDGYSSHEVFPGYESVPFFPASDVLRERDHISKWLLRQRVQPGTVALSAYDFEKPRANLLVSSLLDRQHLHGDAEVFDYPGHYLETSLGDFRARTRIEEIQSRHERVNGSGDVRGLQVGYLFELENHARDDQNREYLVVSERTRASAQGYESEGGGEEKLSFECHFEALDSQQVFRPSRITPSALIRGPQTATVVGKSGEEIWTDEHGRVKVQFHWDRYGERDENASCWVRVSSAWAGQGWGAIQIPRIGQEVIVDFLEGDPDRPIITGRVYNGNNKPPYELPANSTQSGVKSRSTKGGGTDNFNEIRFEDKKGSEEIYIHAEKNHRQVTEDSRNESVGVDRSLSVGHDKSETIDHDKTITVGNDHSETITNNKTLKVGVNHDETIGANMTLNVGGSQTETIGASRTETVGAAMALTVGTAMAVTVGAAMNTTVGAAMAVEVGAVLDETIGLSASQSVGKNKSVEVGKDLLLTIGKNLEAKAGEDGTQEIAKKLIVKAKKITIEAEDEIDLKAGKATITLKKNGDITIKGKKLNIRGSGPVIIKGSKIQEN